MNALVIGASQGIGFAILKHLSLLNDVQSIHAVSRVEFECPFDKVICHQADSTDPQSVKKVCERIAIDAPFSLVICTIGALHGSQNNVDLSPEKRLEDLDATKLLSYFQTNTIAPANWLKYLLPLTKQAEKSQIVFFTARVASIQDNRLGGWYGYRASKAALNMMIKTAQVEYSRRTKNVELISYHPGTVDTGLSKPFQTNVAEGKLFTAEFTVSQLFSHLAALDIEQAPHYIDWQGQKIPW